MKWKCDDDNNWHVYRAVAQIPFGELLAHKAELESLKETVGVDKLEENNNEMDNNNNEMHNSSNNNNKEINKSGSPSPLSLAFSLVNYRLWMWITRESPLIKRITLVTLVPRWVIERRLWPETPPHFSCPLSSRWSGTCHGRPESRLLNISFPASQPSDPRIFPRKKKQGEGNY